jgi:Rne/Rng family ribonuclease
MSKELVISTNRHETKVAILEDDQLVEIFFQRANEYSLAGSIHKGRVTRVLPGMQSAFVDLGLERDTFLYVSDFFEENEEYDRIVGTGDERNPRVRGERPPQEPAVQAASAAAAAPALESAVPAEALPANGAAPQPGAEGGDRQDRNRGRRPRRRRNRGRGFPDSKYASTTGDDEPAGNQPAELEAGPEAEEEEASPAPEVEPSVPVEPKGPVFLLPGESLAKYSQAPAEKPAEVKLSAAPTAPAVEEPAAPVTAEVEAPEPAPQPEAEPEPWPEPVAVIEPAPVPEPEPAQEEPAVSASLLAEAVEQLADIRAELAEAREAGVEPLEMEDDAEADLANPLAMESGEEESESDVAAAPEEEGEEPVRQPQSLTAVLRDRDNAARFQNRSGKRMRRRGRGGQERERGDAQRPLAAEAAPAVAAPAPAPQSKAITREKAPLPSITDLLKEGQEILVQIAKEPMGTKGARITSHIALPGRYCVYMPTVEHMGVSRKIASDEERLRLKRILQTHRVGVPGGYIIRTAGEGKTEDDIASDMSFLHNLWLDIRAKSERRPAPLLVHHDLDIVQRILRDQLTTDFKTIWLDNEEMYESVLGFLQRFQPALVSRVKMYTRPAPIFDAFNITSDLEKALRPKVWLKSGGYIVINQTEALVAIDINTGKYVGKSNRLEDTIVKTNIEAVKEIVRQIRLRDLGGIIVIDFIDMDERKNRQKVMQALEEAMRVDRAPYKILQFNDFGLVAITRKRVKQSLERTLCSPCPYCEGAGSVKSIDTVIGEILVEAGKIAKAVEGKDVLLRVNPDVAKVLKSHSNKFLEEMEEILKRPVLIKSDPSIHHEKFDLA